MEGKWRVRPRALSQLGDHPLSNRRNAGSPSRRTACRLPTYTRGQMLPPSRKLDIRGRNAGRRDLMNLLHPKQARYQASLQPEPQEQRLDSSTRTCARRSTSWNHFWKALERPGVTKPLPGTYKLVENIGRTCQAPRFDGGAIGSATTSLPIRVPRLLRRAVRCQGRIGEFQ